MAGIAHVLNIAKQALLTHQIAVDVTSHNIANVDTEGYSRQSLEVGANQSSPIGAGNLGGGVRAEAILRKYDRFIVQRIADQQSLLSNLEAQKDSLQVVETIFNEASGFGLNSVMNQFWQSWNDLANDPDILATRQTVVQMAELVSDQLHYMNSEVARAKYDLSASLDDAITDINSLTREIARINREISSIESGESRQANDLRDRRDLLVEKVSAYLDISYFESGNGQYTLLLGDGHPLVDGVEQWDLDWLDNKLRWLSVDSTGKVIPAEIGDGAELGGKVGGWLEIRGQLVENDPTNILGRLNSFANSLIREVNQRFSQGVGMEPFSEAVTSLEEAPDTVHLTTAVDAASATEDIPAGTISINGRSLGRIYGAAAVDGLATGKAKSAVDAINSANAGVRARLTTQVAGGAVTAMTAAENGSTISFTVNGVAVNYTVAVPGDDNAATLAANLAAAINSAISAHNSLPTTAPPLTVEAVVGDGANGGPADSVVLRNTNSGDESPIVIAGIDASDPVEAKTGLTDGTYNADSTHNTGKVSIFSERPFDVVAGTDDYWLDQLGMGGGLTSSDTPNDGRFTYTFTDPGGIADGLLGYHYADELDTVGKSFNIWIYNKDKTLAVAEPVQVSIERAWTLQDVADAVNAAVVGTSGGPAWLTATVEEGHLKITPDADHMFAFGGDSTKFLQVAGLNTFFTGHDASDIGVSADVAADLSRVAAGTVTDNGEIFHGDNSNAILVANIENDENVRFTGSASTTLNDFYNSLVSEIGSESRTAARDYDYNVLVQNQLQALRDDTSGVSLDEEMANLIMFQQAYTAAAKLITTSDEMLQSLLDSLRR